MKATKRLRITVWTVEYEIVSEGKVMIIDYSCQDPEGYQYEKQLPRCHLKQTKEGIVTHLWLKPFKLNDNSFKKEDATEIYEVINPKVIVKYHVEKTNTRTI